MIRLFSSFFFVLDQKVLHCHKRFVVELKMYHPRTFFRHQSFLSSIFQSALTSLPKLNLSVYSKIPAHNKQSAELELGLVLNFAITKIVATSVATAGARTSLGLTYFLYYLNSFNKSEKTEDN